MAREQLPCLSPSSCAAGRPQSHFGLCCWADREVSVPSGKTEWVFLAMTQALEEAAALLPPASPSEGERMRGPVLGLGCQGLCPDLAELGHQPWWSSSSALPSHSCCSRGAEFSPDSQERLPPPP